MSNSTSNCGRFQFSLEKANTVKAWIFLFYSVQQSDPEPFFLHGVHHLFASDFFGKTIVAIHDDGNMFRKTGIFFSNGHR